MNADFFRVLKNPVDFYIIRHGQSEGNAAQLFQGREESPLSEEGRLQAAARGRSLKTALAGDGKTLLFSSPLGRAIETAEFIAKEAALSKPVFIDELLEMHLGIWSGKNWDEVKSEEPALWSAFMAKSWDAIPEAESSSILYERALLAWAVLRDTALEQDAKNVISVSHGGLIQWLVKSTMQNHSWFPLLPIRNCGLFKFCVRPKEQGVYMCWEEFNSPIPS